MSEMVHMENMGWKVMPRVPLSIVADARVEIMEYSRRGLYAEVHRQMGYAEFDTQGFAKLQAEALQVAQLWWVAADMVTLFDHAAPDMPSQKLQEDDMPDHYGMVFFERPISGVECFTGGVFTTPLQVSAMAWYPAITNAATNPTATLIIDSFTYVELPAGHRKWTYLGQGSWSLGEDFDSFNLAGRTDVERASVIEDRRRIAAIWTLSQQVGLANRTDTEPGRADARRSIRRGIDPSPIRVVRLRRIVAAGEGEEGEGADRHYSHRWMVSGHWRNQYLPSRDTHRIQWIAPYVKGPEDKPLVLKETVKAWVR